MHIAELHNPKARKGRGQVLADDLIFGRHQPEIAVRQRRAEKQGQNEQQAQTGTLTFQTNHSFISD